MPRGLPADTKPTFFGDGLARYVSAWCALTRAAPDNSCLFFIPASADPGYHAGDSEHGDPLKVCFPDRTSYTKIQANPLPPGGVSLHTHRTIHWGSSSLAQDPRISLSFAFADADFEPPYIDARQMPFPPHRVRLALFAAQMINYATLKEGDAPGWLALAGPQIASAGRSFLHTMHACFTASAAKFAPTYRGEIARKFVETLGQDGDSDEDDEPLKA